MIFSQSVIETMEKRQSVRTFDNQKISDADLQKIKRYLSEKEHFIGPFGSGGRIESVEVTNNITDKGIKLGTYGFIKNPKAYLVGICANSKMDLLDFAYTFQKLVLFSTEMGLGTCWMGGTFSRNSFEKEIDIPEENFIPCITPIGYPHQKQRVFDKAVRFVVKADNKKPWNKLFFDEDFNAPLEKDKAGSLETPIEMVRLGPSASNKQPWRLVLSRERNVCHFYIEHTPNYSSKLGYDMQMLDMGIAMCQFELACKELNIGGRWRTKAPELSVPNEQYEYISSWETI